jgi:TM2 domain-containing membrane protein YozV
VPKNSAMVNGSGSAVFSQEEKNITIGNAIIAKNVFFIILPLFIFLLVWLFGVAPFYKWSLDSIFLFSVTLGGQPVS